MNQGEVGQEHLGLAARGNCIYIPELCQNLSPTTCDSIIHPKKLLNSDRETEPQGSAKILMTWIILTSLNLLNNFLKKHAKNIA